MSADGRGRPDPLEVLAAHLGAVESELAAAARGVASEAMSDERMSELTDLAITNGRALVAQARRRRRRRIAVITGAALLMAGGGAVAAAILRSQPDAPNAGPACRAEADVTADAIVVDPGGDPVADCRGLWDDGAFEEHGITTPPDDLVACISPGGGIDVFPGSVETCEQLGLAVADTDLTPDNQAIVELQQRLIAEINAPGCLTTAEAETTAQAILDDLGLTDWPVKTNPDAADATCTKAGIGPDNHHVFLFKT